MQQRQKIHVLTRRTLLLVLIVLQDLLPVGNLPLGPLSITTMPITVAVIAVVFGPTDGILAGTAWGLLTWVRAFVYPSSPLAPLLFTNPVISVVPRILVGLFAGLVFASLAKHATKSLAAGVAGLVASLTNTALVLGGILLFANTPAVVHAYHAPAGNLAAALLAVVGTNGVVELVVTTLVTPLIALPLRHAMHK